MPDTTVTKVDSNFSPKGGMGQRYLASGVKVALRLWNEEEPQGMPSQYTAREYEVVGYVIKGRAKLEIEDQSVTLNAGDSWVVPAHARHRYEILETFSALEATAPPAQVHGRDDASRSVA